MAKSSSYRADATAQHRQGTVNDDGFAFALAFHVGFLDPFGPGQINERETLFAQLALARHNRGLQPHQAMASRTAVVQRVPVGHARRFDLPGKFSHVGRGV